jgi:hypothetical protein
MSQTYAVGETAPRPVAERLTTPFEDWCERHGVRPEESGAWALYEFVTRS